MPRGWAFLCSFAMLVFVFGEPITAGVSVGLLAAMLRFPGLLNPSRVKSAPRFKTA